MSVCVYVPVCVCICVCVCVCEVCEHMYVVQMPTEAGRKAGLPRATVTCVVSLLYCVGF